MNRRSFGILCMACILVLAGAGWKRARRYHGPVPGLPLSCFWQVSSAGWTFVESYYDSPLFGPDTPQIAGSLAFGCSRGNSTGCQACASWYLYKITYNPQGMPIFTLFTSMSTPKHDSCNATNDGITLSTPIWEDGNYAFWCEFDSCGVTCEVPGLQTYGFGATVFTILDKKFQ